MTRSIALKILGLKLGYSDSDLKTAYRKTAKMYHPDINKSADAPAMFARVKEAYTFLLNSAGSARVGLVTHSSIFSIVKK